MGPMQKALRDAGLPIEVASVLHLEQLARKAYRIPETADVTPAEFRKAARLHRKMVENPRRWAKSRPGQTKHAAKRTLREGHGLTSGRQWRKWKKQQQRAMRAEGAH